MALINGGVRTGSEDESVETDFETDGEQIKGRGDYRMTPKWTISRMS